MQVKKFVAADMRRALDMVRTTLGPDAVILSTTRQKKGIEVMAAIEEDVIKEQSAIAPIQNDETLLGSEQLPDDVTAKIQASSQYQATLSHAHNNIHNTAHSGSTNSGSNSTAETKGLASGKTQAELTEELEQAQQRMIDNKKRESMTIVDWADQSRESSDTEDQASATQAVKFGQNPQYDQEISALKDEITNLRSLLESQTQPEQQTSTRSPVSPITQAAVTTGSVDNNHRAPQEQQLQERLARADIMPFTAPLGKRFSQLGLQQKTIRDLLDNITQTNQSRSMTKEELWPEALANLADSIPVNTDDPVSKGGIFALLGTTGVGKTTTVAKLAARHVLTQGAEEVALVTTDTYRIAAHDQLRSLGRILNVSVTVVDNLSDLPSVIEELSHHKLIILDTPGMNHSDPLLADHLSVIDQVPGMKPLLVLSANSQYQMMKASVHAYQNIALEGCVLTKLDESASLGEAISLLADHNLPLTYITDGQSVPDDIDVLKAHQLIARSLVVAKGQQTQNSSLAN